MIQPLIDFLISKKLKFTVIEDSKMGVIIEFSVQAKPQSKVEKIFVNESGFLSIQTRARPIDGEANQAIIESLSKLIGVPKYQIEILRGDKSKIKRIKLLIDFSAKKTLDYYIKNLSEI